MQVPLKRHQIPTFKAVGKGIMGPKGGLAGNISAIPTYPNRDWNSSLMVEFGKLR